MSLSRFERLLPWTGALAGVAWVGQDQLKRTSENDEPGSASSSVINGDLWLNIASIGCVVVMGVALVFFATAVRNLLRAGEAREATYSSVAYGGWLLVVSGLSQMTVWGNGMLTAAYEKDDEALGTLDFVGYFGWAGMTIGLSAAFLAMGLGGMRNAVLPRWFSITTAVMGVLCGLGAAHIPPGGLVSYVLLPFWLVGASVIIARRQRSSATMTSVFAADKGVAQR